MGYTHYWQQHRDFTRPEWVALMSAALAIIDHAKAKGIRLTGFSNEDPAAGPHVDFDEIGLNGFGKDAHETLCLARERDKSLGWFCKTARKPYDPVVCSILLAAWLIAPDAITLKSDGDYEPPGYAWPEWTAAVAFYDEAVSRVTTQQHAWLLRDMGEGNLPKFREAKKQHAR